MNQYSSTIENEKVPELAEFLREHNFKLGVGQDLLLSAVKEGCSVRLYRSLKLLVQGKETEKYVELLAGRAFISRTQQANNSRRLAAPSLTNMLLPRIGSDESGKGDYFGPLVIAAVFVDDRSQEFLEKLGTKDSKLLSDTAVVELAYQIRKHAIAVAVPIGPARYNELYPHMRSVNRILGWGHARAIENILEKQDCNWAVADQFGDERFIANALLAKGKEIHLKQMPKAEADIAVAAASIVAREEFLRRLSELGQSIGVQLPKGASSKVVLAGIAIAKELGFQKLTELAKIHFKTTGEIRAALNGQPRVAS